MKYRFVGATALFSMVFASAGMAQSSLLVQTRIVGGSSVAIDAVPSTVALLNNEMISQGGSYVEALFCGGTVIADTWVLTAAHCLYEAGEPLAPSDVSVFMGGGDLRLPQSDPINVSQLIVHEDYDPATTGNDIALLRLEMTSFSPSTPIDAALIGDGELAFIAGWGAMNDMWDGVQEPSTELKGGFLRMVPADVCVARYPAYSGAVIDSELCADREINQVDTCQGDSGGPLYRVALPGGYVRSIAGLTSWGVGCGQDGLPGVYTRVGAYAGWILSHAEDAVIDTGSDQAFDPVLPEILPNVNDTRELGRLEELGVGGLGGWIILSLGLSLLARSRMARKARA